MTYLIITYTNNQHFLLMRGSENTDEPCTIRAYKTKEDVMNDFNAYTTGWTGSYEKHMSCLIGMMNMQPIAIEAPQTEIELIPYIKEYKIYRIAGGVLGRGFYALPVNADILKLKSFDIWKESMRND